MAKYAGGDFAPYGIGLLALIALLVVVGIASKRWRVSRTAVYVGIVAALVAAALVLPNLANMAEFYGYFLNSIIVTVGTLVISITSACWGIWSCAISGVLSVAILVAALAFRGCPGWHLCSPTTSWQLSGLYDTQILLILTLVGFNQPLPSGCCVASSWRHRRRSKKRP